MPVGIKMVPARPVFVTSFRLPNHGRVAIIARGASLVVEATDTVVAMTWVGWPGVVPGIFLARSDPGAISVLAAG